MRACVTKPTVRNMVLGGALGLLAALLLGVAPAGAEDGGGAAPSREVDCRFEPHQAVPSQNAGSQAVELLPENDVFRPLLADPKQPQFSAVYQAVRVRTPVAQTNFGTSVNVGLITAGENFGLVGKRSGCDGWQVGILGGISSQFNLDASSADLINADYQIGIPVSWRKDRVSARARLYHQSSHLGDEFILGNPGFRREDYNFEEAETIVSLDSPGGRWRAYGGLGYLLRRSPNGLDRLRSQWGVEFRGSVFHWDWLERATAGSLKMTPVFGADFKVFEELNWEVSSNVVTGVEWSRTGSSRRIRLLVNYYNGFNPYGQFVAQKVETVGFGVYLVF